MGGPSSSDLAGRTRAGRAERPSFESRWSRLASTAVTTCRRPGRCDDPTAAAAGSLVPILAEDPMPRHVTSGTRLRTQRQVRGSSKLVIHRQARREPSWEPEGRDRATPVDTDLDDRPDRDCISRPQADGAGPLCGDPRIRRSPGDDRPHGVTATEPDDLERSGKQVVAVDHVWTTRHARERTPRVRPNVPPLASMPLDLR